MTAEKPGTQSNRGKYLEILNSNIAAVNTVADTVRATIGPKGMDVMLIDQYGEYAYTNDGVTILSSIEINHPVAKLMVEVAKSQENKVGDGTTTATLLAASILNNAWSKISNGAAQNRVIKGINLAKDSVIEEFKKQSKKVNGAKDSKLKFITKIAARGDEEITSLLIQAATKLKLKTAINLEDCIYSSPGYESRIIEGLFIKKKSHFKFRDMIVNAPTLVIEGALEPEAMPVEAISTDEGVKQFTNKVEVLFDTAKKIAKAGVKAVFVDASVHPGLEEYFAKEDIFVLSHVKKSDLNRISISAGTSLINRKELFASDVSHIKKSAGLLNEIDEEKNLGGFVLKSNSIYIPTILISAQTSSIADEKERIAIDAAQAMGAALKSGYLAGEGVAELNVLNSLAILLDGYKDDENICAGIELVREALKTLFMQIVSNAGFDPNEMLAKLQEKNDSCFGIDLDDGSLINLEEKGVLDPAEVKINALRIAAEIACQVLKINMVLQAKNI